MAAPERRLSGLLERIGPARIEFFELRMVITPADSKKLISNPDLFFQRAIEAAGMKVNGWITDDADRQKTIALARRHRGKTFGLKTVRAHVEAPPQHRSKHIRVDEPTEFKVSADEPTVSLKRVGKARASLEMLTLDPNDNELALIERDPAKYLTEFFEARGEVVNDMLVEDGPLLSRRKGKPKSGAKHARKAGSGPSEYSPANSITIVVHIEEGKYTSRRIRIRHAVILP